MQLLIILALLLYGGKSNAQNLLSEVKPVLETIGGEDMKQALKSAEEISSVLSAVKDLTSTPAAEQWNAAPAFAAADGWASAPANAAAPSRTSHPAIAFPLAPVSALADRQITYSLSRYVSQS